MKSKVFPKKFLILSGNRKFNKANAETPKAMIKLVLLSVAANSNIVINMNVLVDRSCNINDISSVVQQRVHDSIVQMTEFKDVIVNVNVLGFYYK